VRTGHTAKVVHLAFSDDSSTLASSSWDHTVGLWSVPAFQQIGVLRGHVGPVNAAAFSDDGSLVYTAGADGHVRLWDVAEVRYLKSIVEAGWGINVLAVSEPLDLLAYGTSSGLLQTRALHGDRPTVDLVHDGSPVLSLSIDATSRRLACGNAAGRLIVVDAKNAEIERDFHAANGPVWTTQLVSSGQAIVFAGLDDFITRMRIDAAPDKDKAITAGDRRFHPTGELDNGARQFARKCSICHTLAQDDKRRAGPSLHGVFGRRAGTVSGYPYSDALASADIVWTEETIDVLFREGPDKVTPGSKMPLQRISNLRDRQDLIQFLKTHTGQ
jgi:cytochrome c